MRQQLQERAPGSVRGASAASICCHCAHPWLPDAADGLARPSSRSTPGLSPQHRSLRAPTAPLGLRQRRGRLIKTSPPARLGLRVGEGGFPAPAAAPSSREGESRGSGSRLSFPGGHAPELRSSASHQPFHHLRKPRGRDFPPLKSPAKPRCHVSGPGEARDGGCAPCSAAERFRTASALK